MRAQCSLKICCLGPENIGPNVLINKSVGMQLFGEVEDSLEEAFDWVTKEKYIKYFIFFV